MRIAGLQKFSMIDYDDKICAVVFTQGCNLFCPYCHNPKLVPMLSEDALLVEEEVLGFLQSRVNKLDGVVITGGEPLLQKNLIPFVEKLKQMGYLVKLDTNGVRPDLLENILKLNILDYVAMDIKTALDKYEQVVKVKVAPETVIKSIQLIKDSAINHEFRTTLVDGLISEEDIYSLVNYIPKGSSYYLQNFQPSEHLDSSYKNRAGFSDERMEHLKYRLQEKKINFRLR